jgi:hypothetical protein
MQSQDNYRSQTGTRLRPLGFPHCCSNSGNVSTPLHNPRSWSTLRCSGPLRSVIGRIGHSNHSTSSRGITWCVPSLHQNPISSHNPPLLSSAVSKLGSTSRNIKIGTRTIQTSILPSQAEDHYLLNSMNKKWWEMCDIHSWWGPLQEVLQPEYKSKHRELLQTTQERLQDLKQEQDSLFPENWSRGPH